MLHYWIFALGYRPIIIHDSLDDGSEVLLKRKRNVFTRQLNTCLNIYLTFISTVNIISVRNLIMKSRDFVRRYTYLLHDDVTGWTDYINNHCMLRWRRQSRCSSDSSDNEEEVPTSRGSFPQPYALEPTSTDVNYHDDADSETSGSDDRFQGFELEVTDRTSGTRWKITFTSL